MNVYQAEIPDVDVVVSIPCSSIRFVKELYPRLKPIDGVIERYRDSLPNLPPILVARDGVLVDGYHRWQAHVREEAANINVINLGNLSDAEIIRESIRRNSTHGQQLSRDDKKRMAAHLWRALSDVSSRERLVEIADLLSVDIRSAERWTKDARRQEKEEQQAKAWDLWLDCGSFREIAKTVGVAHTTIEDWCVVKATDVAFTTPPASRQHFDIWSFQTADDDAGQQSYFGAVPPQVVENLLWYFTKPGDVVVDLFAGSGTTVDVAKSMGRRIWASDIRGNHYSPHLPIHQHDALEGWPPDAPNNVELTFLDPPYWQQAAGRYSNATNEMAEMDLPTFMAAWDVVVDAVAYRSKRAAFIISPTQCEDGSVVDHMTQMLPAFIEKGWKVERRIIVPYSTQQATGQQVEWARDHKRMLKLYRDLVVVRP